jgi:hypothetical protein
MTAGIRVTATDMETGESQSVEIMDDYVIIAAGSCQVANIQAYPATGTHQLTVKGVKRALDGTK